MPVIAETSSSFSHRGCTSPSFCVNIVIPPNRYGSSCTYESANDLSFSQKRSRASRSENQKIVLRLLFHPEICYSRAFAQACPFEKNFLLLIWFDWSTEACHIGNFLLLLAYRLAKVRLFVICLRPWFCLQITFKNARHKSSHSFSQKRIEKSRSQNQKIVLRTANFPKALYPWGFTQLCPLKNFLLNLNWLDNVDFELRRRKSPL